MTTAIIVLHFGKITDTLQCLQSLEKLHGKKEIHVYIVDNGTKDFSKKMLPKLSYKHTVISNRANLGYAGGNNVGLVAAFKDKHKYFLILNNDVIVEPDLIDELKAAVEEKDVGIAGCVITYLSTSKIWYGGGKIYPWLGITRHLHMDQELSMTIPIESETDFITGAAMMIKKEVITRIGLLPEAYFLYWEDVEYCYKAKKAGFHSLLLTKPLVKHAVSSSTGNRGTNKLSPVRAYYYARNPFVFMKRNRCYSLAGFLSQIFIQLPFRIKDLAGIDAGKSYLKGLIEGVLYTPKGEKEH